MAARLNGGGEFGEVGADQYWPTASKAIGMRGGKAEDECSDAASVVASLPSPARGWRMTAFNSHGYHPYEADDGPSQEAFGAQGYQGATKWPAAGGGYAVQADPMRFAEQDHFRPARACAVETASS